MAGVTRSCQIIPSYICYMKSKFESLNTWLSLQGKMNVMQGGM